MLEDWSSRCLYALGILLSSHVKTGMDQRPAAVVAVGACFTDGNSVSLQTNARQVRFEAINEEDRGIDDTFKAEEDGEDDE
ncbi:hypothetical protein BC936DRAFT_145143, partial [Jimgerdemannia flammicorona]